MVKVVPVKSDIVAQTRFLHELAECAGCKGKLVAASYGENSQTGEKISPEVMHFEIGSVDSMVEWIFRQTREPHRNVYVPLASFKPTLAPHKKGGEGDIETVLGLVADFDDSDAANYPQRLPALPDYVLETSKGRYQAFYFFTSPVEPLAAKQVAQDLKKFANCDHGTSDISHVWRVAGTLNWPNKKKVSSGRDSTPQLVKIKQQNLGNITNFANLERALCNEGTPPKLLTAEALLARFDKIARRDELPGNLLDLIEGATPKGNRSEAIFCVVKELIDRGFDDDEIEDIISSNPQGIGEKYADRNDLRKEIVRIREKLCEQSGVIRDMNAKYAVVTVGNKGTILSENIDPATGEPSVQFLNPRDLKLLHGNQYVQVGEKKFKTYADFWLAHPSRRGFDGVVFDPSGTPKGFYNLWKGFPVKPVKDCCNLYLSHIFEVICQKDKTLYNYVIHWMADAVQNPASRPGIALVLRGEEGAGKGVFVKHFAALFGSHFRAVYQGRHLTGNFNAHLAGKLLVFADEAVWAGDKAAAGVMKSLITEDFCMIERKGFDAINVRNFMRLIIASNDEWVVPAGTEARRFFVLDVGNAHRCDTAYFAAIAKEMENGGREALMDYLLSVPLSGINLRKVPQTRALFDQKMLSASPIVSWWYETLMRGEITPIGFSSQTTEEEWPSEVLTDDLYTRFLRDRNLLNDRYKPGFAAFGTVLKRLLGGRLEKTRRRKDAQRIAFYKLPPLVECRRAFSKAVNFDEIPWDEE